MRRDSFKDREFDDAIEYLIEKGREAGYVTSEDIDKVFAEGNIELSSYLDELLARLHDENIEVYDELIKKEEEEEEILDEAKQQQVKCESPIRAYLKEINQIPLLSAEEERKLAIEMEKKKLQLKEIELKCGLSARKFRKWYENWKKENRKKEAVPFSLKEFSVDEIDKMLHKIDTIEGEIEKIKRKFIESNLRLVVNIAKKYVHGRMSLLDLINEGNLGLVKAVDRYNYMEGYRFSTYAIWWIRQTILRAISEQARTIRIPIYMVETINRCMRTIQTLSQQLGRDPELEEIAEKMHLPVAKVIELINIAQDPISLETPMGVDGESQLGDLIEDKETLSPAKASFLRMLQEKIKDILNLLSEKERMTLKLRFGLDGMEPHTLEEVGKILGLTRERARQIEKAALEKLRRMKISRELYDFLTE